MRSNLSFISLIFLAISVIGAVANDQIVHVKQTDEGDGGKNSYSLNPCEQYTAVLTSAEWKVAAVWGAFTYGLTGAAGELMNQCNWCWPHHQIENNRCAVDFSGLAKSLGILAAIIASWVTTVRKHENNVIDRILLFSGASVREASCFQSKTLTTLVYSIVSMLKGQKRIIWELLFCQK